MRFFNLKLGKNRQYAVVGRVPLTPPKVDNAPVENPSVLQHLRGLSPIKFKRLPAQGPMASRVSLPLPQGPFEQVQAETQALADAIPEIHTSPPSRHDSLVDGTPLAEGRTAGQLPTSEDPSDPKDIPSHQASKQSSWSFGSSNKLPPSSSKADPPSRQRHPRHCPACRPIARIRRRSLPR